MYLVVLEGDGEKLE